MSNKKKKDLQVRLEFLGTNTVDVTGSALLATHFDHELNRDINILIECGSYQASSILNNYNTNKVLVEKINSKKIDYIILADAHQDHTGNTVAVAKNSKPLKIFMSPIAKPILNVMWADSAFINEKDCQWLKDKKGIKAKPLFTTGDIEITDELIETIDTDIMYNITPNIHMRYLKNKHNIASCSLELFFKNKNSRVSKLFYSSDLGSTFEPSYFVANEQKPPRSANVTIIESTYGNYDREFITKKLRKKELQDLKKVLEKTILEKQGSVLFPTFSYQRMPALAKIIYDMISTDERFSNIPLVIDSNLANNLIDVFERNCTGEDKDNLDKLLEWKNLIRLRSYKESVKFLDQKSKIILSSAGFCHTGRVQLWLKELLPYKRNTVVFTGYTGNQGSVATKIREKDETHQKTIKIDKSTVLMNSDVVSFNSFSSHLMRNELVNYATSIQTSDYLCLVHGSENAKIELAETINKRFEDECISTKVVIPKRNQVIYF